MSRVSYYNSHFRPQKAYVGRRGSRINTDRFPKRAPKAQASRGVRRRPPPGNFLDFYSLKSPFLDFIVIQKGYWPDSNLESVFIIKNIFVMKNVTDFRKTVETGVDPRLVGPLGHPMQFKHGLLVRLGCKR